MKRPAHPDPGLTSGLLEETSILIGGDFGRTPSCGRDARIEHSGRGHDHLGFCMGLADGATDDLGWKAVENPAHIHRIQRLAGYQR